MGNIQDSDFKWPYDSKIQKIYDVMRYQTIPEIYAIFLSYNYTHYNTTYLLSWNAYSSTVYNNTQVTFQWSKYSQNKNRILIIYESIMSDNWVIY